MHQLNSHWNITCIYSLPGNKWKIANFSALGRALPFALASVISFCPSINTINHRKRLMDVSRLLLDNLNAGLDECRIAFDQSGLWELLT